MKILTHSRKILLGIAVVDFVLVFAVLMMSRGLLRGTFPRWYYLAATSLAWAVCGILTHKLEFWYFTSRRRALWTVLVVDIIVYALSFIVWKVLFPDRGILVHQLWPLPFILAIECMLYLMWHNLFRKVPYLYVENIERPFNEQGIDKAVRYADSECRSEDLASVYEATRDMEGEDYCRWIRSHRKELSHDTLIVEDGSVWSLQTSGTTPELMICLQPFNEIHHLNQFLAKANEVMPDGGIIAVHGETSGMRRHRILSVYPPWIGQVVALMDYLWSRVMSKLALTRWFYMSVTKGRNRNFPRVEVLGRIVRAGFDICGDEVRNGTLYISAVKRRTSKAGHPFYGLFIRLPRKGKNGKDIGVFKLRTMYAYSEYIQDYIYRINGLEQGGKLKDDFRVNPVGLFCRSRFLDEIPMFINFFKGDLKLVGVRPLSKHYLSLYTPGMQQMHLSVKPGIFPPLYYEYPKPGTIAEIQESERRYIEQYRKRPYHTDWIYFWGMMRNILLRRERSH